MENFRRSWVEINLAQIKLNYQIYKQKTAKDIMAVVKADAYGHGAVKVASVLQDEGCSFFAVSNIKEAIELKEAGIKGQILILGYTPIDQSINLLKYDITQALLSEKYAEDLMETKLRIKCQYAIDTGMNRIGLNADNVDDCRN